MLRAGANRNNARHAHTLAIPAKAGTQVTDRSRGGGVGCRALDPLARLAREGCSEGAAGPSLGRCLSC